MHEMHFIIETAVIACQQNNCVTSTGALQAQKSAQEEQRQKRWQQLENAASKKLHSSASAISNAAR